METVQAIVSLLKNDGVVALPTRSVYGLSCLAREAPIKRILNIKKRPVSKGMIMVASDCQQLLPYVDHQAMRQKCNHEGSLTRDRLVNWLFEQLANDNDHPITWVVPAKNQVSRLIKGSHDTIAVRLTQHPLLFAICQNLEEPIISTSANPAGYSPVKSSKLVENYFGDAIDYIYPGIINTKIQASHVIDWYSGIFFRK